MQIQTTGGPVSRRNLMKFGGAATGTVIAATALAACSSDSDQPINQAAPVDSPTGDVDLSQVTKGLKVGVIVQSAAAVTQGRGIKEIKRVADQVGWTASVFDANGDPNRVPGAINDFITQKVDVIIPLVVPGAFFGDSLAAVTEAEIPVVGVFTGAGEGITARVEPSEFISIAKIGEYIIERMNYEGEIALLNWEEIPPLVQRGAQIRAVLQQYPDITIVEDIQVKLPGQIEDAKAQTAAFLPKYPNLKCIWSGWDEPAFGANQAVKEAGRGDVFVTGCDGNLETYDAIRNGEPLSATCGNDIELMTRVAVKVADDIRAGRPFAPVTCVDSPFVAKQNVPPKGSYAQGTLTPYWTGA